MKSIRTHYENLQVTENASPEVIRGAYRYLSQKWHPDKNPDNREEAERITRLINAAYEALSDPQQRKEHDEWISAQRRASIPDPPPRQSENQSENTPSATAQSALTPQGASFLKRALLMLLFVTALLTVLGVLPYQLLWGDFKWSYVGGLLFWLGVGRSAYVRLFHPEIVADEKREGIERQKKETETRKKATTFGWAVFALAIPLSVAVMMIQGAEFEVAALMSLFVAAAVGLLGWSLFAMYLRAIGR